MSKLLKSKFLLGVLVVAVLVVGFAVSTNSAAASNCSITSTLRVGSKGTQVTCLQAGLSLTADGSFGPKTKAAVVAWQKSMSLVADGVFGAKSRAVWTGGMVGTLPAGCTSTSGYSPVTGVPCSSGVSVGLPAGCTSTVGFSATTGLPCSGTSTSTSGPVSVMLASDNPASSTLVAGQATADLAHFVFTGVGSVTNVTLKRIGVSADATPSNVYLFDGATRLTDAASVASNGTVTFNSASGLFAVNGSKTISVKSDIALLTSGQTVGFMLATFTVTGGTAANANLSGNVHTIASASLAAVSHGTVTPSGATINPGPGVTLWQDTLNISTRDVWMKRLALRNVGSAPAASFANFKLYVNGVSVGTAMGVDANGYVTFDFMSKPVLLQSGSRVVRMDADVVSGASRTVQFSLRNAADVDFVDSSFGVNITPTSTPWASSSTNTISGTNGGTLTIEKDTTSPSTNVVLAGNDVNLGTFKITAFGESIKIETLTAGFTFTDGGVANAGATLRNGRLLFSTDGSNWTQYGSTATLVAAGTSFTTNYTVAPGTSVLAQVHADVYDNDGTGALDTSDTLIAKIVAGSLNAQRVDSLGSFNAPASAVPANSLAITSGAAVLSKNSTYASQTTTLPATNFKIGSWNLAGSSVEDILLTTLSFDVDAVSDNSFENGDITNMYVVVKNGSNVVAQPSPLATVSAVDDNFSVNYTLLKNTSVTIELFGNLSDNGLNNAAGAEAITSGDSFKTDLTVTGTSLTGGTAVTATSADTNGQTIAYGAATLTATVDASSPVEAIVSDNQTIDSVAYKFSAATSAFNLTDLTLLFPASGATVIQNVMLYSGTTLIASLPGGATSVSFSGLNWNVPVNTSKVLTVKLQLGEVGLGAGTTGADLTTTLDVFTAVSVSTGVSDASAADAGPSIESPAQPASDALYAHAAIPTITQSTVSTSLINAIENDMYKFVVSPTGGPVALKQLKFTVVVNDNVGTNDTLTVGSFKLFRGSTDITSSVDIHNTAGATLENTNSLAEGTGTVIVTWSTEEQISSSTEFTLKATPTGFTTAADDDYVNTTLAYDSAPQTSTNVYLVDLDQTTAQVTVGLQNLGATTSEGTIAGTVTTGPNVVWSDISSLPHTETVVDDADGTQDAPTSSADWRNGYLIQSMPLSGVTKNN